MNFTYLNIMLIRSNINNIFFTIKAKIPKLIDLNQQPLLANKFNKVLFYL